MFGVLLIALGVVGLVLDGRGQLPERGYAWVPGAAIASLVGDTAFGQPAPWDATLNVVTAACVCGALCLGLAGFGSAIERRDLLGTAYTWLTSAVVGPLGLSVTAIVAAASFDEPAWVFALLVVVVTLGALGAAAAMFLGVRELAQNRQTFAEYEKLVAVERAQRRLGPDVDLDEDELAGLWADDDRPEAPDAATAGGSSGAGRPRSRVGARIGNGAPPWVANGAGGC